MSVEDKKFWHELAQEEVDKLLKEKVTIGFVMENFKQPVWCGYPDALSGRMGCWSLMDINGTRKEISIDFCKDCDCFNKEFLNQ